MGRVPRRHTKVREGREPVTRRHIVLTDDGVTMAYNASHRLMAVAFFPESPKDQAQALFIGEVEREDFLKNAEGEYQPSEIMRAATKVVENQTAQHYSVGLVALSYIWLHRASLSPSLTRATTIAARAACEFDHVSWRSGLAPDGDELRKSVTGDAKTVARIFRSFRSVAHIHAARISAATYLDHLHVWDQPPVVVGSLIQTCAAFQVELEQAVETRDWNLWDVTKHFPAVCSDMPVLQPDDYLYDLIERGFTLSVEEGAIRERG
jgi:hypothetical protein